MKNDLIDLSINDLFKFTLTDNSKNQSLEKLKDQYLKVKEDIKNRFEDKVEKIKQGDELLPSVMKNG